MYGWSEAEALAMNISATIPEAQREESKELVWRLQRGEVVDSLKTKRQTKDDRILDVWLTVTRLTDENGVIRAIATTERDVSGLKTIRESIDRKKEKS
jgi:two-component system CheB/CheR fusion protein